MSSTDQNLTRQLTALGEVNRLFETVVVVEALASALQPICADELRAGTSMRGLATLLGRWVVARLAAHWGSSQVVRALLIVFPFRRWCLPHQSSP